MAKTSQDVVSMKFSDLVTKRQEVQQEEEEKSKEDVHTGAKTATDVQRIRLDRLFENIHKPVNIPNPKKERQPRKPPEFVRNVVGSSAGAGSAEFHIYRNNRKKEYARLEYIEKVAKREAADQEWLDKVEEKKKQDEEKTAKKRAKRLKKKEAAKKKRLMEKEKKKNPNNKEGDSDSDSDDCDNSDKDNKKEKNSGKDDDKSDSDSNEKETSSGSKNPSKKTNT